MCEVTLKPREISTTGCISLGLIRREKPYNNVNRILTSKALNHDRGITIKTERELWKTSWAERGYVKDKLKEDPSPKVKLRHHWQGDGCSPLDGREVHCTWSPLARQQETILEGDEGAQRARGASAGLECASVCTERTTGPKQGLPHGQEVACSGESKKKQKPQAGRLFLIPAMSLQHPLLTV